MKGKISKSSWACVTSQTPIGIWNKPNLFANASLCSGFFQYAKIISQALINLVFFLLLGQALIFWWIYLKIALYSLFGFFIFFLIWVFVQFLFEAQTRIFQSRALLKMNPSSPFMEELCLDIQKEISLKKQSLIFHKITKCKVSKAASNIMRMFTPLNIHYNNSLSNIVHKKNET